MNTAVATIEQPTKEAKPLVVVSEQLEQMADKFRQALPAHIPLERFKRVVMTAIQNNPDLMRADRFTLWTAATKAAQDGLLPDGREGALVIFNTKMKVMKEGRETEQWVNAVQWMPMIAGLRKKVRNSGAIADWNAHVVYARDKFSYRLGDDQTIMHEPYLGPEDPGEVIAAYSIAKLKSGEISREVMTRREIDKVRAVSKSREGPAWKNWFTEMARKTVARRHSKVLPMSTDLDDLMRRDDALYDFDGAKAEETPPPRPKMADFMDAAAASAANTEQQVPDSTLEAPSEQPGEAQPTDSTDNPMPEFSAADAYAMGKEHRAKGRPLKSPPPEWRDGSQPAFLEAWEAGWRDADDEAQAAKKK